MNAKDLHSIAIVKQVSTIMLAMRSAAQDGQFSYYTIDQLETPILEALRDRGFTVKAGYSGGYHITWLTC